jgi:hypothetical protein
MMRICQVAPKVTRRTLFLNLCGNAIRKVIIDDVPQMTPLGGAKAPPRPPSASTSVAETGDVGMSFLIPAGRFVVSCKGDTIRGDVTLMSAASKLQFCLEKAGLCDAAAAAAKGEHVQALYRALAAHWRDLAAEIELADSTDSEPEHRGANIASIAPETNIPPEK